MEDAVKIVETNNRDWEDGNYDIVEGKDGYYQFYAKKNVKTGEEAFMVAKYLFDAQYISKEDALKIIGVEDIEA